MTAFLRGVRAFLTTRPVIGLGLVFLGFLLSVVWLLEGILETGRLGGKAAQWLEPASLVATTLGAAITAATLISRRSPDTLRVAHGGRHRTGKPESSRQDGWTGRPRESSAGLRRQ